MTGPYESLIELLSDENQDVRKAAAEALGRLGNPEAIPALTELIRDKAAVSREAAFEAIWKMGKPVLQTLADAAEEEPEPYWYCGKYACEQLGRMDEPAVVMPVLKYFSKIERDKYTRSSWSREDHALLLGILNGLCIKYNEIFTEALSSEHVMVRRAAAIVLGTEKISLAFTFMAFEKMITSGDAGLQLKAIRSLREFPADLVNPILSKAAKVLDPQVAKAAEEALFWVQHQ
ncbi:MAG: HEAT repeat domain-containing protein [Anaerolineaceae bacterium]